MFTVSVSRSHWESEWHLDTLLSWTVCDISVDWPLHISWLLVEYRIFRYADRHSADSVDRYSADRWGALSTRYMTLPCSVLSKCMHGSHPWISFRSKTNYTSFTGVPICSLSKLYIKVCIAWTAIYSCLPGRLEIKHIATNKLNIAISASRNAQIFKSTVPSQ